MAYRTGLELSEFLPPPKKPKKQNKEKKNKWETGVLFGCFHCFFKSNKIAITCHIPILMHPLSPFIRDALIHVCRFSLV